MTQQARKAWEFVLLVPSKEDAPLKKKRVDLSKLKDFPGSWKVKGLDRIIDGALSFSSESGDYRHFRVHMKYERGSVITQKPTIVEGDFDIWQHKNGYAIAVKCPNALVDTVASLLSLSIHGELGWFHSKNLEREDFMAIQKHAFSLGGVMAVLHLRDVKVGDSQMSVYSVSGKNIGNPEKLINAAKKIKRMGFRFPRLGSSQYHFWVANQGNGTLYQPSEFLPHQVITLAKFFEEALKT